MRVHLLAIAAAAAIVATPATAQDYYASFSAGAAWLDDSDNSGKFTENFVTGQGTTLPAGTALPSGTSLGWTTEFENGYAVSGAFGRHFGSNIRGEIELAYQSNDIDTHSNVRAAGILLDNEDAGVLITGSGNLGATVGALVDDGQGSVESTYLMANAYYDFNPIGAFRPYVGGGVGVAMVDVDYSPSDLPIISDDDTVFAYQAIAGASFDLSDRMALFAQYRYRGTDDVETNVDLIPAALDIENRSNLIEAGIRFRF